MQDRQAPRLWQSVPIAKVPPFDKNGGTFAIGTVQRFLFSWDTGQHAEDKVLLRPKEDNSEQCFAPQIWWGSHIWGFTGWWQLRLLRWSWQLTRKHEWTRLQQWMRRLKWTTSALQRCALLGMMGTLRPDQKAAWKSYVPGLVDITTRHKATGFTPYCLMFGRPPRLPVDLVHSASNEENGNVCSRQREKLHRQRKLGRLTMAWRAAGLLSMC